VLQQLGWLHHQQSNSYSSQQQAIEYLEQSVGSGKCYVPHPVITFLILGKTIKMPKAGIC
jgi:hypothetical protein